MNAKGPPARPLWQTGVIPETPFFQMRQPTRNFYLDAVGLWSYPALVLAPTDRLLWLHLVCPVSRDAEKPGHLIFRPRAAAWTKPEDVIVARYQDYALDADAFPDLGWDEPIGRFPHPAVDNLTEHEMVREEMRLLCWYREVGQAFREKRELPQGFVSLYLRLTHPAVLRCVRHLAPRFCGQLVGPATEEGG